MNDSVSDSMKEASMFKWKKLGKIFDPALIKDRPWISAFAQAPSTLIFEDRIRVYFACRPPVDSQGNYVSLSAYADFRRDDPSQLISVCEAPLLPLGGPGSFDEFGAYFTSVIRKDEDVLAYYVGYSRCESVPFTINIGAAISHDGGDSFARLGPGPALPCALDEPFFLTVPRIRHINGRWYLFYSAGQRWLQTPSRAEPVYQIRMATSDDGINWVKHGRNLVECRIGENECQACPDVFEYGGRYHMLFSYRASTNYHGKEGGYRMGYASSDDLFNWVRDDDKAGLEISEEGWDSEMVSFPHVFAVDGAVYLLYLGNQMGRHGFGLARLEN
ncbi:hypothetical protein [Undibacterium sp. YM2]|uniref:hypothetical protein n=1 Tax=Undibacterium sp. YM2 TaxID=2058625 RepID=UPI0018D8A9EA|nr:hypothetical protein [Undibacterium sp. YM2]